MRPDMRPDNHRTIDWMFIDDPHRWRATRNTGEGTWSRIKSTPVFIVWQSSNIHLILMRVGLLWRRWEDSGDNVLNNPTLCQLLAGISCFSLRPQRDGTRQLKQNFLVRVVAVCRANDESKSAHRQFTVRLLSILLAHKFCLDSMSMWIAFKFVKQRTTKKYNPSGICAQSK